jgi:hypothetical protein
MSDPITWHPGVDHFDANPTATVALDRARWEALGATFIEVDDGDDETPGLAVGQINGLDFGVLDYGDGETYLLVPEADDRSTLVSQEVVSALDDAGALDVNDDVLDVAGLAERGVGVDDLESRLVTIEQRLADLEGLRRPVPQLAGFSEALRAALSERQQNRKARPAAKSLRAGRATTKTSGRASGRYRFRVTGQHAKKD